MEQNSSLQSEFEAKAFQLGITHCYFLSPQKYVIADNPHHLLLDPNEACSNARCLIALLQRYQPMVLDHTTSVPFSAYYVASNQLYHSAEMLARDLQMAGYCAQRVEIPAKTALLSAGIGEIGENTLLSVEGLGTRFAIQWIVTDAWEAPSIMQNSSYNHPCIHCQRCRNICPGKAIDDAGFHEKQCVRYHMDGQIMPDWVKATMPSLFGCELCQIVCPRNNQQPLISMPETWQSMFQFEKLLPLERIDKQWYAKLVGKNMLTRGRLRAQAFSLAWRWMPEKAKEYSGKIGNDTSIQLTECEIDAMKLAEKY